MARPEKYPINYTPTNSLLTFVKLLNKESKRDGVRILDRALYKCKCGNNHESTTNNVKMGKTLSCGCFNTKRRSESKYKHGYSEHPLYTVWENMYSRCYNSKLKSFLRYGGRGVVMCEEWRVSPVSFIEWGLANGWGKGLEIDKDRIAKELGVDNNLYSPDRCCFVTSEINNNHRRTNRYIEYGGESKTMAQWAKKFGLKNNVLFYRLKKWSVEKSLLTPLRK